MLHRAAAILVAAALATAAEAEPPKIISEAAALQPSTTSFVIHSDRVGRDFAVTVTAPGQTVALPGQKLAVIYALDGGYDVAGALGRFLSNRLSMSPVLVVTVDYLPGQGQLRLVDLAHKSWKPLGDLPPTGGGGAAFEAFLLEELKPWIEAKYAADPSRSVLFGHSLGGVFAANIFADRPDAFAGYIMASVAVWVQPDIVRRVAATAKRTSGKRVFLSVGEFEDGPNTIQMRTGFDSMADALRGHAGLALKTQFYPGENHTSHYARVVLDSFPWVLPSVWDRTKSQAPLPPATLARYTGEYRSPSGRQIVIWATPMGQLSFQAMGDAVVPLYQNGRDRFYLITSDLDVVFDDKGATLSGGAATVRIVRTGG